MALPRFDTIGFRAAVHKPMGDVTDVRSISYIQSVCNTQKFSNLTVHPVKHNVVQRFEVQQVVRCVFL